MMMENEFKVGDHVKCVDATHIPQLVHGREYIVASGNNGKVVVQDIAGVRYGEIEMSRFEKVEDVVRPDSVRANGPVIVYVTGQRRCGKSHVSNMILDVMANKGYRVDFFEKLHVTKDGEGIAKSAGIEQVDIIVVDDFVDSPVGSCTQTCRRVDQGMFDDLCDRMKELHAKKGDGYVKDVIGELPIEMWTSQIVIKATRAHYAKRDDKRVDELFDTAVYCLLTLEEMARQGVDMAPIMGVGNHV